MQIKEMRVLIRKVRKKKSVKKKAVKEGMKLLVKNRRR